MNTEIETNPGVKAPWIEPKIEQLHVNETAGVNLKAGLDTPPSSVPSMTGS